MAKRLTKEEINARLDMYEEAASHLELEIADSEQERRQARIVASQIRQLAVVLVDKHINTLLNHSKDQ